VSALPPGQRRVLCFVEAYLSVHDYPPTLREIRDGLGFASLNGIHQQLCVLEHKGYIERRSGLSRSICVLRSA